MQKRYKERIIDEIACRVKMIKKPVSDFYASCELISLLESL